MNNFMNNNDLRKMIRSVEIKTKTDGYRCLEYVNVSRVNSVMDDSAQIALAEISYRPFFMHLYLVMNVKLIDRINYYEITKISYIDNYGNIGEFPSWNAFIDYLTHHPKVEKLILYPIN